MLGVGQGEDKDMDWFNEASAPAFFVGLILGALAVVVRLFVVRVGRAIKRLKNEVLG